MYADMSFPPSKRDPVSLSQPTQGSQLRAQLNDTEPGREQQSLLGGITPALCGCIGVGRHSALTCNCTSL
jgi:hypothetical protein